MEKDIGKLQKNDNTDIVIRIDDFGGRIGLTIREYVNSDRYTGFTKAGVRINAKDFSKFKEMINSIPESEFESSEESADEFEEPKEKPKRKPKASQEELPDY